MGVICGKNSNVHPICIKKAWVLSIYGGPGAGVCTQTDRLIEKYKFMRIDVDELIDDAVQDDTDLGQEIKTTIANGGKISAFTICKLIKQFIDENGQGNSKYLLQRYPKSPEHAQELSENLSDQLDLQGCMYIKVDIETMKIRQQAKSGKIPDNTQEYNTIDVEIDNRIKEWNEKTIPLIKTMKLSGKCFEIDGERSEDHVFFDMCKKIELLMPSKRTSNAQGQV